MRAKIDESRASMLKSKVIDADSGPKRLWRTAKHLLHTTKSYSMSDDDCTSMCKILSSFFSDKKLKKVNFEIYIADRKATTCI